MPRRVQDIIPNKHRSIRDIPVERNNIAAPIEVPPEKATPKPRSRTGELRRVSKTVDEAPREKPMIADIVKKNEDIRPAVQAEPAKQFSVTPPHVPRRKKSRSWLFSLMGIVLIVAGVGYIASVYFSQATFSIVPVTIPVSVNANYVAQASAGKDTLVYELAAVRGSASTTVTATEGQQTSTPAKGSVTLYNAYSKESQQLIAGTRLSDDTGRIYRLTSSVVIPGYTSAGPGTLTTTVTADKPGPSYNISRSDSVSDFKIVAYKGTPRYSAMYARLATDISGGFTGIKKTVAPTVLAAATTQLKTQVTDTLKEQVRGTIPEGYMMYDDGYVIEFSEPSVGGGADEKSATVSVEGTLYGILFKKDDLIARLAGKEKIEEFAGFAYEAKDLENLDFSIANQKDFSPEKKNSLIVKLKGDMKLVGSIPEEEIKSKLAGLPLSDTVSVLRHYKPVIQIDESSAQIIPPWSKVPRDTDRISIEVLTK